MSSFYQFTYFPLSSSKLNYRQITDITTDIAYGITAIFTAILTAIHLGRQGYKSGTLASKRCGVWAGRERRVLVMEREHWW